MTSSAGQVHAHEPPLATICSDGTLRRMPREGEDDHASLSARLVEERSLLGEAPEPSIGAVPALSVGGTSVADSVLGATLARLPVSGDLAPYGWRIGPGTGVQWHANRGFHEKAEEAARIAFFDYTGPLTLPRMGPVGLASSTFGSSGERVLGDPGLTGELPHMLGEAIASADEAVRTSISGSSPRVLLDERGAVRAMRGRVPTVSGYRFHRPLRRSGVTELWGRLLGSVHPQTRLTFMIDSDGDAVAAALDAGAQSIAVDPLARALSAPGPVWERLADARESGVFLTFVLRADRLERSARHVLEVWRRLGYPVTDAQGLHWMVSRGDARAERGPVPFEAYLEARDIDAMLRLAPSIAERVAS